MRHSTQGRVRVGWERVQVDPESGGRAPTIPMPDPCHPGPLPGEEDGEDELGESALQDVTDVGDLT